MKYSISLTQVNVASTVILLRCNIYVKSGEIAIFKHANKCDKECTFIEMQYM